MSSVKKLKNLIASANNKIKKTNKSTSTPKKYRIVGDSITIMGSFQNKLKTKFNAEVIADSFSGSQAGMGLTACADEYWAYVTGENAFKYSNDITGSGWAANAGITRETGIVREDLCVWNKVTRVSSSGDDLVFANDANIPTGTWTGIALQFEMIPVDNTKVDIWFAKYVTGVLESGTEKKVSLTNLVMGRKYKVVIFFDKSKLNAGWTNGDSIKMKIFPGGTAKNDSVTYFRNFNFSFKSPNGIENYTQTTSSAAAGSTATLTKLEIQENQFDATIVLFGRNEASKNVASSAYPYIGARSYFKAFDKLISQCKKNSNYVIPMNCPPKKHDTLDIWDVNDPYKVQGLNDAFNSLKEKHNTGINVYENFIASGKLPSILMYTDGLHESDPAGGDEIISYIVNEVGSNRSISNNALPELSGTVKHYLSGTNTGTWTLKTEDISSSDKITNTASYNSYLITPLGWLRDVAWISNTPGDKIVFSGVNGKQVHVVFRIGDGFGKFYVKLNAGTAKEVSYSVNSNYIGMSNQIRGYYIFDNIPAGDNTVDIVVSALSLTGTVTFTSGSSNTIVTGSTGASATKFLSEVPVGSYIKLSSDADSVYAQVASVQSDSQLTLASGYTGTIGTGGTANRKADCHICGITVC